MRIPVSFRGRDVLLYLHGGRFACVYVIKAFIWEWGGWFALYFVRFRFRPAMGLVNAVNVISA